MDRFNTDIIKDNITRSLTPAEVEKRKLKCLEILNEKWGELEFRGFKSDKHQLLFLNIGSGLSPINVRQIIRGAEEMCNNLKIKCTIIALPEVIKMEIGQWGDFVKRIPLEELLKLKQALNQ